MSAHENERSPYAQAISDGRLKSAFIAQPEGPEWVQSICDVLNSEEPAELGSELLNLVREWQASGPNLAKMLQSNPALNAQVRHGRTLLVESQSGRGYLMWMPNPSGVDIPSWKGQALCHFMNLIVNPRWHKLGGPCHRCNKYYVKKTSRQKVYCSPKCGASITALAATQKKRAAEHADKLDRVQNAAYDWINARTQYPWKKWVSPKTNITVKWITRAVNKGALRVPVKDVESDREVSRN